MTLFFRWVQTSVRFSGFGSQKVLGKIGIILNLRDVKIIFFFRKLLENNAKNRHRKLQNKPYCT